MSRRKRRIVLLGAALVLLAAVLVLSWYPSSSQFRERMRAMAVDELERTTGGRVEMGSFAWNLSQLSFEIRDLTIHGLEGPDEIPYAHADRVLIRAKIRSILGREIALSYVGVEHPIVHLIVYPDGSTNQPPPKVKGSPGGVERMLELEVNRLELRDGQFLLNEKPIPLDLTASDLAAELSYNARERREDGKLRANAVQVRVRGRLLPQSKADMVFRLWPTKLQVENLTWETAHSRLEAAGNLQDFKDPKLELTYKASLQVNELGAFTHLVELRAGQLVIDGQGSYASNRFSSKGKVILSNGEWQPAGMKAFGVNAGGQFTATNDQLFLSHIFGAGLGGSLSGTAELRNWTSAVGQHQAVRPASVGSVDLRFDALQLSQLAAVVSTRSWPLEELKAAGLASGTLRARWVDRVRNAEAQLDVAVVPPAQPATGQLPVTARLQAGYRGPAMMLEVTRLDLATPATRVDATGVLGSTSANFRVALNSTDISEFGPVLAMLGEDTLPADVHGRASFKGTVSGKLESPTISGRLEMNDFDSLLSASEGTAKTHPPRIHWDLLRTDLTYSRSQAALHHGLLRRGAAQIDFDATARLRDGRFDRDTPFTLRAHLANADVADAQSLLEVRSPLAGRITMDLDLTGTRNDLHGRGRLQAAPLTIAREPFQSLQANLRLEGHEVRLTEIVLAHDGARITGALAYDLESKVFRFDTRGSELDLAHLQQLQTDKYRVTGKAGFTASGSGTMEAPSIDASVRIDDLIINGERVGKLTADAVTHGAELRLSARAYLENAELRLKGGVHLRGDWPADIAIRFNKFDIDPFLRAYLGGRVTGHSSMAGIVDVKGPLRQPRRLNIDGTIDQFSAEIQKMSLGSVGQVRFAMVDEVFTLKQAHFVAEDTNLVLGGSVQFHGAREMNFHAEGPISMRLLQTLDPDLEASGGTYVKVNGGGTVAKPDIRGEVEVEDGRLSFVDLPNGLSHINGKLMFNQNRLEVSSLTAETGGGKLGVTGALSYAHGVLFSFKVRSIGEQGTEQPSGMRLRYPPGVSANAIIRELEYTGSLRSSRLAGTIEITRFALNSRFDFAAYLARSKQPQQMVPTVSPLNNVQLDVHITSGAELQVQTSSAKLLGNLDLRVKGTAAHPVLLGRVNVLDGDVSISGTKYHIETGDVTFSNPTRIEPVVNIEATARIRDYDISLGVHGVPPDKLNSSYRSDPPLPTADIIALLALGRTTNEPAINPQPTQNYTESASSAILGEALSQSVSSRAQKLFGLSRIKIDPQAGGPESNPNARITIEQQVSDKVTLTYITNLAQSSQQIIQVEYNVNRNFTIIAVRDQNGVLGFDVRYRQRKH